MHMIKRLSTAFAAALAVLALAACGDPPPYAGEWSVDMKSSTAASPRTAKARSALKNLARAQITIDADTWVLRVGDWADTRSFKLVAQEDNIFKLEGSKGGVVIIKVLGADRISGRQTTDISADIILVLDRAKG